jgi:RNA 2',3'-cyclic 3'-phosphodiesterase
MGTRASAALGLDRLDVRLFFAALPAPQIRRRIESVAAALSLTTDARRVLSENYHMTVAFAGEVSREQATALRTIGAAVRHPSFEVQFDAYEYWQPSGVVVAAARECPQALRELHRVLRAGFDRLALPADSATFRAHVTLARKITQAPVLAAMCKFSWMVRDFQLISSARSAEGSVYTVVDSWPLLDSAGRGA